MHNIPNLHTLYQQTSKNVLQPYGVFTTESWHARYYGRYLSIIVTWFLLHTPLTPNAITLLATVIGVISGILLSLSTFWSVIGFFIGIQLYMILDNSDGEVARFKRLYSPYGYLLDTFCHIAVFAATYIGMGVAAWQITNSVPAVILGAVTAVAFCLSSLLFHLDPKYQAKQHVSALEALPNPSLLHKVYSLIVGEVELSWILLIWGVLWHIGLQVPEIFTPLLILNFLMILGGGIVLKLYSLLRSSS